MAIGYRDYRPYRHRRPEYAMMSLSRLIALVTSSRHKLCYYDVSRLRCVVSAIMQGIVAYKKRHTAISVATWKNVWTGEYLTLTTEL